MGCQNFEDIPELITIEVTVAMPPHVKPSRLSAQCTYSQAAQ